MAVKHWDKDRFGELNEENMRQMMEGVGYAVTRYVYPPETHFSFHSHEEDKIDGVLSGKFRVSLGEDSWVLESGDYIFIAKGEVYCAEVIGNEPVISLDAVKHWTRHPMMED